MLRRLSTGSLAGLLVAGACVLPAGAASPQKGANPVVTRIVGTAVSPQQVRAGQTVKVTGRLVDVAGKGVRDEQVDLQQVTADGYPAEAYTAADGSFALAADVPAGARPQRLSLTLAFAGSEAHVPSTMQVGLTIVPGGRAAPSPTAEPSTTPVDADSADPAPGATVLTPPSPTPTPAAPAAAPAHPDALPLWLRWAMGVLAFVGALVGFAVASHQQREPEQWDRFIGDPDQR